MYGLKYLSHTVLLLRFMPEVLTYTSLCVVYSLSRMVSGDIHLIGTRPYIEECRREGGGSFMNGVQSYTLYKLTCLIPQRGSVGGGTHDYIPQGIDLPMMFLLHEIFRMHR